MVKTINSQAAALAQEDLTDQVMGDLETGNLDAAVDQPPTEAPKAEIEWDVFDELYSGIQGKYKEKTGQWASPAARTFAAAKHLYDTAVGIDLRVLAKHMLPQGTSEDRRAFIREVLQECGVKENVVNKGNKICMHLTAFQMESLSFDMRRLYGTQLTQARDASKEARAAAATAA